MRKYDNRNNQKDTKREDVSEDLNLSLKTSNTDYPSSISRAGFINLFMQLPLLRKSVKFSKIQLQYCRSIYSTDSVKTLQNKYQNINSEHLKENFIHSFSTVTVLVKEML